LKKGHPVTGTPLPDEARQIAVVQSAHEQELMDKANVVGVGIGNRYVDGRDTGELCLSVLVTFKRPREALSEVDLVPRELDGVPVDVRESGYVQPLQLLGQRVRPAFGGVSIGHATAGGFGTLGTTCFDRTPAPIVPSRYYVLSNAHVLARSGLAAIGDAILQPGGGNPASDQIGQLTRFVPIQFTTPTTTPTNLVDAAIAQCAFRDISREVYWVGYPRDFNIVQVGDIVVKTGARTGFTTGRVENINLTIDVGPYPEGLGTARFIQQISTTSMANQGDSGSLVCKRNGSTVGLLFASSSVLTVVNPIELVLRLLDIRISGDALTDIDP
jgi:Trypsin